MVIRIGRGRSAPSDYWRVGTRFRRESRRPASLQCQKLAVTP
ncbi:Uncharacterised protein [Vibrio cholerae]|nr:Uncharacterised protein [Vibrio cholerae]